MTEDVQYYYHYTSIDAALKIIRNETLRFNAIKNLNDPFEFKFRFDKPEDNLMNHAGGIAHVMRLHYGVISFSVPGRNDLPEGTQPSIDPENHLMWSHYADKHRGIVLGFLKDDSIALEAMCREVPITNYCDKPQQLPYSKYQTTLDNVAIMDEFVEQVAGWKEGIWKYEQEIRFLKRFTEYPLGEAPEHQDVPFSAIGLKLGRVDLGWKSSPEGDNAITNLLKAKYGNDASRPILFRKCTEQAENYGLAYHEFNGRIYK